MGKKKQPEKMKYFLMDQHYPKSTRLTLRNSPTSEPLIVSVSACLAYQLS